MPRGASIVVKLGLYKKESGTFGGLVSHFGYFSRNELATHPARLLGVEVPGDTSVLLEPRSLGRARDRDEVAEVVIRRVAVQGPDHHAVVAREYSEPRCRDEVGDADLATPASEVDPDPPVAVGIDPGSQTPTVAIHASGLRDGVIP